MTSPSAASGENQVAWRSLARFVAGIHIAYVVFVVFGALLVLVWPRVIWLHLAAVIWSFLTMVFDLGCPLTPWEKNAWIRGGRIPYEEGFLQHHILRTTFAPEKARRNHTLVGIFVVAFNLLIYYFVFR